MAVCTPCTVVFRSALMSVIITFMFEPAKLQMNCASASGASMAPTDGDERDVVGAVTGPEPTDASAQPGHAADEHPMNVR